MSLATWKAEFYPITAQQAAEGTALQAAEHSLVKWIGLRKENRERHETKLEPGTFRVLWADHDPNKFEVDSETCSLCEKFAVNIFETEEHECKGCPLFEVRGDVPCYGAKVRDGELTSPYAQYTVLGDPEPMIGWLAKAVAMLKERS